MSSLVNKYLNDPNYQLSIEFSQTGRFHLLIWHTHNEQNRIIVARTLKSLLSTWKHVVKKYNPKIQEYWIGNIITPPDHVKMAFAKERLSANLYNFKYNIISDVNRYVELTSRKPKNLDRCYLILGANHNDDCPKCNGLNWIPKTTWEDFFEEKGNGFSVFAHKNKKDIKTPIDNNIPYDNNKPLYMVLRGNYGISFKDIQQYIDIHSTTLFLFQGDLLEVPSDVLSIKAEEDDLELQKKLADKKQKECRLKKMDEEEIARLIDLFE